MPSTDTSPEPTLERVRPGREGQPDTGRPEAGRTPDSSHGARPAAGLEDAPAGFGDLVRELAEDTRTLVQQEIELVKLEVAHSAKRVAVDSAWISAGAVVITVGLVCLALALALGIGALLDSYWLGTLITALAFLLLGGGFAWRGVRDLTSGGLLPTGPLDSFQEDREWAKREIDDFKQGITEDA